MSHSAVISEHFIADFDFSSLIDSTTVEEDNEVYLTKLALSVGRSTYHLADLFTYSLKCFSSHRQAQVRNCNISP